MRKSSVLKPFAVAAGLAVLAFPAFANDPGTSYQDLVKGYPAAPGGAEIVVDQAGFARLSAEGVAKDFAPDVPVDEQKLIAVTQGPIRAANFGEKATAAAWSTKPSCTSWLAMTA